MRAPTHQFLVRMPFDVCEWLEAQAATNCRSKNQEIVFRLRAAMAAEASQPSVQAGGATAAGQASQA